MLVLDLVGFRDGSLGHGPGYFVGGRVRVVLQPQILIPCTHDMRNQARALAAQVGCTGGTALRVSR